jgi:uncharacterized integral membrane protein
LSLPVYSDRLSIEDLSEEKNILMATIIILLMVLILVAVFSVQNAVPTAITFLIWRFEASLAIVIFLTLLCGMIAGAIIASLLRWKPSAKKEPQNPPPGIR